MKLTASQPLSSYAPFTRERNLSVSSTFRFLERKIILFTREQNDCVPVFVSDRTGKQSFRSISLGFERSAIVLTRAGSITSFRSKKLNDKNRYK